MTNKAKVIALKPQSETAKLTSAHDIPIPEVECVHTGAEYKARRLEWQAATGAFAEALSDATEKLNGGELSPELQAFAKTMQEHGPAMALAMFGKLFTHIDIQANFNMLQIP